MFDVFVLLHLRAHSCARPDDPLCSLDAPIPLYIQLQKLECCYCLRKGRHFFAQSPKCYAIGKMCCVSCNSCNISLNTCQRQGTQMILVCSCRILIGIWVVGVEQKAEGFCCFLTRSVSGLETREESRLTVDFVRDQDLQL